MSFRDKYSKGLVVSVFILLIGFSGLLLDNVLVSLGSLFFIPYPLIINYLWNYSSYLGIAGIFSPLVGFLVFLPLGFIYEFYIMGYSEGHQLPPGVLLLTVAIGLIGAYISPYMLAISKFVIEKISSGV